MIASKITQAQLEHAACIVGVRVEIGALSGSGLRHRVKVYPIVGHGAFTPSRRRRKGKRGDALYQRESAGYFGEGRRVHAVCWHGFRDFFRACFSQAQQAVFRTALATWDGAEDFERRYQESGRKNIGSLARPVDAAEACRCSERGIVA